MKYVNAAPVSLTVIYFNVGNKLHQILVTQLSLPPYGMCCSTCIFHHILHFII